MKKIEIYEHCFGAGVVIDDISLDMEYDYYGNLLDNEANKTKNEKIDALINKLKELKHSLDQRDLYTIAEMVATRGGYEYNEELSQDGKSCDQCGNYNYSYVYQKQ